MTSKERILAAVAKNQPAFLPMPSVPSFELETHDLVEKFSTVAVAIGARVFQVSTYEEVKEILFKDFNSSNRIISSLPELAFFTENLPLTNEERHQLQNVDVAIEEAHFGVAENGAVWLTEELLDVRVVPFICQHLVVILPSSQILPLMHDAYERIGSADYGYGVFIAGPSKTADIEQSLVLGAHGPRTMTIFLMN